MPKPPPGVEVGTGLRAAVEVGTGLRTGVEVGGLPTAVEVGAGLCPGVDVGAPTVMVESGPGVATDVGVGEPVASAVVRAVGVGAVVGVPLPPCDPDEPPLQPVIAVRGIASANEKSETDSDLPKTSTCDEVRLQATIHGAARQTPRV